MIGWLVKILVEEHMWVYKGPDIYGIIIAIHGLHDAEDLLYEIDYVQKGLIPAELWMEHEFEVISASW